MGVYARSCARSAVRLAAQAHCIVIQLPSRLATLVTIQNFVLQPNLASCNTLAIQILQYNSLRLQYNLASLAASYCNTTSTLQYKFFLSHNTIWAVAHFKFSAQIFFFRFFIIINFFFSFISSNIKIHQKSLKIIFFFIFLDTQINS